MREVYGRALKLLGARDYSTHGLRLKLQEIFGEVPEQVIERLTAERFLDDRRFAETFIRSRIRWGRYRLERELERRGIPAPMIEAVILDQNWPSAEEILEAKMNRLRLRPPLTRNQQARLFRAARRLGYDTEEILRGLKQFS